MNGLKNYTPCICEHEGCAAVSGVVWWPGVVVHTPHAFVSARECQRGGCGVAAGHRRIPPPRFCEREGEPGVARRPGVVVHTPHAFASARECRRGGCGVAAGHRRIPPPRFCKHKGEPGVARQPGIVVHTPNAFASARECRHGGWDGGRASSYTPHAFASTRGSRGLRSGRASSYTPPMRLQARGSVDMAGVGWRPGVVVYTPRFCEREGEPGVARRLGVVVHTPHVFASARECRCGGRASSHHPPRFCERGGGCRRLRGGRASSYTPPTHLRARGHVGVAGVRWRPGVVVYTLHAFVSARGCRGPYRSRDRKVT
jgi:hypothetical protein